jgi:hypothetical protein
VGRLSFFLLPESCPFLNLLTATPTQSDSGQ